MCVWVYIMSFPIIFRSLVICLHPSACRRNRSQLQQFRGSSHCTLSLCPSHSPSPMLCVHCLSRAFIAPPVSSSAGAWPAAGSSSCPGHRTRECGCESATASAGAWSSVAWCRPPWPPRRWCSPRQWTPHWCTRPAARIGACLFEGRTEYNTIKNIHGHERVWYRIFGQKGNCFDYPTLS